MIKTVKKPRAKELLDRLRAYLRTKDALRLLISVAIIALSMLLFVFAVIPARYDLRVGQVPTVTIAATKDVVDEVTTEQKRVEAAASVAPTYKYQEGVTESVLTLFDQIFAQLRAVRQYGETLPARPAQQGFTREELDYAGGMLTLVTLRDYQMTTLLKTEQPALEALYDALYAAIKNTMSGHVTQGQENDAIQSVSMIVGFRTDADLLQNVAQAVLRACIQPNMVVDQEATEAARQEARKLVESVVYKQGQNIVVKGEGRVTVNQLRMLQTLGLLRSGAVDLTIYLGGGLLVFLTVGGALLLMRLSGEEVMRNTRRMILLGVVLALTLGLSILARAVNMYAAPVVLAAMLLSAMVSLRAGVYLNVAMALLVSALAAGGNQAYTEMMVNIFAANAIAGTFAAMMMSRSASRVRALITGVCVALIDFLVMLAFGLMTADSLSGTLENALWCMGGGALSGILCIAIQPALELIFNLPTPMKLLELSNPNSPLLRRLMLEAPGTYHHSILVANLAEASAEAIHANPLLARVGAYYHDIGKLKRPLYFKENQLGIDNAHDHTEPQVSAAILTAHTRDGVSLAKAYHLPYEIQRIIAEHHGNTPVMFFYHKALQQSGGAEVNIDNFRYDGERPSTKESAIIMICDTVEAAVRSQKNVMSEEELEEYIVKLVRTKLADGQLNRSPLTLNDIDDICVACATVLKGVYHERIEYPDAGTVQRETKQKTLRARILGDSKKPPVLEKPEKAQPVNVAPAAVPPLPKPVIPDQVDENDLLVTPPPADAPISIDELIRFEPLTKVDPDNMEIEERYAFAPPEDEPGEDDKDAQADAKEETAPSEPHAKDEPDGEDDPRDA